MWTKELYFTRLFYNNVKNLKYNMNAQKKQR